MDNDIVNKYADIGRELYKVALEFDKTKELAAGIYNMYRLAVEEVTGTHFDDFDFEPCNDMTLAAILCAKFEKKYGKE
jgi:hypothetical protein